MRAARPGPLALVGGEEFMPGNAAHDGRLVAAAARLDPARSAYIIATAAARKDPDLAVATARSWFAGLGLEVEELRIRKRSEARSAATAERAANGRFFYLTGGDPGLVPAVLAGTPTWASIVRAWRAGAVLAGSSAGAMALGDWTLVRAGSPGDVTRLARPALGLLPGVGVVPHFSDFGHRWVESALSGLPERNFVLAGIDERSAAVWQDGTWWADGSGGVTVIRAADRTRFEAGERIEGLPGPAIEVPSAR